MPQLKIENYKVLNMELLGINFNLFVLEHSWFLQHLKYWDTGYNIPYSFQCFTVHFSIQ